MSPDRVSNPGPLTYESDALPIALRGPAVCLDIFTLLYPFSPLSPSLWETARYRLKYCLKGPLNPKQPTNQIYAFRFLNVTSYSLRREIESITLTMQNSYHTTTVHNGETMKTERIYAETMKSQVSFQIVQCYASNQ